jgi:carbon monoxide dehydrogenase subunit G
MHRFEHTETIPGVTAEQAFAYITDPSKASRWLSSAKEVRAEGEPGVGRVLVAKASLLGASFDVRSEVTTWDEPNAYGWAGSQPFHSAFAFTFTDTPEGVVVHGTAEVDPGKFLSVGGRLLGGRLRKMFEGDVASLAGELRRLA